MELVDRIENCRFLGREFLLWLWFSSDQGEGRVSLGDEQVELWIEESLVLSDAGSEVRLKAPMPSATPEAFEALRQNKLPAMAKLRLTRGTQAFSFVFRADEVSISGLTLPAEIREDSDESLHERLHLVETFEGLWAQLLVDFLAQRASRSWNRTVVPKLRAWMENALRE